MNLFSGVTVAALGLLVAILSIAGVIPGLTQTGVVMILGGGLIIGLSFIDKPTITEGERMSTPATLGNIFFSPAEVFQNLKRHPRWLAAAILVVLMSTVYTNLFMYHVTPERVTNHVIDKTMEMPMMNDEARTQIEAGRQQAIADAKNPVMRAGQAVSGFVGWLFWFAFLALIFFLFALAMGGTLNYWQAFSVAVYATFASSLIRYALSSVILFFKDPVDIHPILGQGQMVQDNLSFLFDPATSPVLFSVTAVFGLLTLYWVWLNAVGLKHAGEKVSGSTAWTASLTVFFMFVVLSAAMAFAFPGFIS
ncbi:MAG: YIP1 family protein [Blastocatellia bacterium]|nr:YIP1 family protein [Blastocatellia bacterium]